MPKPNTPGQAAFEAWASVLDRPYPITWDQHPPEAKEGWEFVAQEAIDWYIDDKGPADVE